MRTRYINSDGGYKDIESNFYSNKFLHNDLDSKFYKGSWIYSN